MARQIVRLIPVMNDTQVIPMEIIGENADESPVETTIDEEATT